MTTFTIDLAKYKPEDGGILDCWLDLCSENWLYVTGLEEWFSWTGTHWEQDRQQRINKQIQTLVNQLNQAARDEIEMIYADESSDEKAKKEAAKAMYEWIDATKRSRARVASVITMAQAHRAVSASVLNTANVLNLKNCTLDVDSLATHEHSRDDYLTYTLDYDHDPNAQAPRFERFMTEVLVKEGTTETDQELCDLMQEAIGYSLTNDTKLEAMFWLSGEGGNGKTVLVETLKRLVGDMAAKINFSTLGQQGNYSLANVPGKRILFSTESKRGGGAAEEYIKQIVSGEVIDARAIYGRPFEFTAVGKIWWAMNDKPTIKDTGNSVWRRLLLIPFNRTFGEQDKDIFLRDTLNQELSGILNFAINGLKRLRQNRAFTKSTAVQQAINQYKHETNPVKQWLDENTEPTKDAISSSKLLYTDYEAWCEDNGRKALNSVHFGIELSKLKVKDKKATAGKLFAVKLINPTPHTVKQIWNGVVQHYAAVEGM